MPALNLNVSSLGVEWDAIYSRVRAARTCGERRESDTREPPSGRQSGAAKVAAGYGSALASRSAAPSVVMVTSGRGGASTLLRRLRHAPARAPRRAPRRIPRPPLLAPAAPACRRLARTPAFLRSTPGPPPICPHKDPAPATSHSTTSEFPAVPALHHTAYCRGRGRPTHTLVRVSPLHHLLWF